MESIVFSLFSFLPLLFMFYLIFHKLARGLTILCLFKGSIFGYSALLYVCFLCHQFCPFSFPSVCVFKVYFAILFVTIWGRFYCFINFNLFPVMHILKLYIPIYKFCIWHILLCSIFITVQLKIIFRVLLWFIFLFGLFMILFLNF